MKLIKKCKVIFKDILTYWPTFTIILAPIVLLPIALILQSNEAKTAYIICVMTVYWVSEVIPLAVTALIPIVLFPIFGILPAKVVAMLYLQDTSWVFIGGMMIGLAIEHVNLHRRFGIGILLFIGCTPARVLVGFMLPTWFLSMWISNSATTAMMLPVVETVIRQYGEGVKVAAKRKLTLVRTSRALSMATDEQVKHESKLTDNIMSNNEVEVKSDKKPSISHAATTTDDQKFSNVNQAFVNDDGNINKMDADLSLANHTTTTSFQTNHNLNHAHFTNDFTNQQYYQNEMNENDNLDDFDPNDEEEKEIGDEMKSRIRTMAKALCISVAYSANIGGTATMTGSSTNLIVVQGAHDEFAKHNSKSPLNYASWLFYCFPLSILCQIACWLWLQFYFLGWRSFSCKEGNKASKREEECIRTIMVTEYKKLGKITFGEISTACLLIILVLLWLTRDPGFMPGYASLFPQGYITDSVPAIFISVILFFYPSEIPQFLCLRKNKEIPARRVPPLLDWETVSSKLPWSPVFLLGGGFALAEGCKKSGLSDMIGNALSSFSTTDDWIMVVIVTIVIALITEIMSNTAVIALFVPIISAMAENFGVNPLYFLLPAGIAASFAFLLPIATPPNAIVFSYGHVKTLDMIIAGIPITIICLGLLNLTINTFGVAIFDLKNVSWNNFTEEIMTTKI